MPTQLGFLRRSHGHSLPRAQLSGRRAPCRLNLRREPKVRVRSPWSPQKPASLPVSKQLSKINGQWKIPNDQRASQQPAAQQPAASSQQAQRPAAAAASRQPAAKQRAASSQQQAASSQQPAASSQQPAPEVEAIIAVTAGRHYKIIWAKG